MRDALLAGGVAVAHGHGLILERVAVDREAERRADLVHARVALADRLLRVELAVDVLAAQIQVQLLRDLRHAFLVHQRENAGLDRRHRGWNFMYTPLGRFASAVYASHSSASTPRVRPAAGSITCGR